jgi:hypothetical protein
MRTFAQDSGGSIPIPPMQSKPWTLSSTNSPPNLQSAVSILFRTGMADPRGCDYREIEVVVGRLQSASGVIIKTRGWVLPAASGALTNYAIGWNGLVYPVMSVGNPASAENDARDMIQAMGPPAIPNRVNFDVGIQTYVDEEYSLNTRWLTQAKAAMIFRFASPELVEECSLLFPRKDPFLALSTGFIWVAFDRAMSAHMRGDDTLAYATANMLDGARKTCEAEAMARGFELQPAPQGAGVHSASDAAKRESYFPFLKTFRALLQDQGRRHQRKTPLRNPSTVANKDERIGVLIDQLENISARQTGQYAADCSLSENTAVQALVNEGWDAVGPLLDCYENDARLTRIIPFIFGGGSVGADEAMTTRQIVDVRSAAYAALEGIIETTQFAPQISGRQTLEENNAICKKSAAAVRGYWQKYRGFSREERLYRILCDDNGQWLEAATIIVQASNKPVMPLIQWGYPWSLPLKLEDGAPMLGEPLRAKTKPSVTELLINHVEDTIEKGKESEDDASSLSAGCDLALCLAKWDPPAGLKMFQKLSDLSFKKLSPDNYRSFVSHMNLAAQLPVMIEFRARAGDTNALWEYASWLRVIDPSHFFLAIGSLQDPLVKFPGSPAWTGVWKILYDDEHSAWFSYLYKQCTPDPTNWSSPEFCAETLFATPVVNNDSFRKFVIRLLHEKSTCGKIEGGSNEYWLDQRLSVRRHYGYTVESPKDGSEITGKEFRICDFYAWLLSNRIVNAPVFQLYWPESQRDEAIAGLEKMLGQKNLVFKTRPFQEP